MGTGHTPSRSVSAYWNGDVQWMGIRDARAHHGGEIWNTAQTITQAGLDNSSARLLPAGTVALSRTASVGYVVQLGREMATSQDFVTWTCSAALDPLFLMRTIQAEGDDIRNFGEGSTHTTIYFPELKALHVRTPPVLEQRRIVAKIDRLSARSKRAREELEGVRALVSRYREAVLDAAFRGDLTAVWRSHNDSKAPSGLEVQRLRRDAVTQRNSDLGRNRQYKDSVAPEWMPEFALPTEWRWASVDSVTTLIQYGTSAKTGSSPDGVPVIRMGNIQGGVLDRSDLRYLPHEHDEFPTLLLDQGDVLFNRTNSFELVGKSAVYEGDKPESFASYLIRLKTVCYEPKLLAYYLNSAIGRQWVASVASQQVGQANVNGTKLSELGVPFMCFDEQREIVRRIEHAFAAIDRLAAQAMSAQKLLDRLDQAVLAKAFRGELVPQDPNDEPASVLLERIRAERAAAPAPKRGRRPKALS
ncbi:MAG: hypothetical protein DI565_20020 [Ancylobacter novellus]|uniref:Type I restriction modification DNA specificity domain-containing protein n=1 Tax=Ancylobacter novellus TaxID=921 RepID=A0A2W5K417_ANCNO|nr:MAG: hypothetical protein DI565_20020 [Ancylobacter novellus]